MPQTENMRRAALVTGGAKGIGRAVCLALAENGMNIAVNYAGSAAAAEETAAACRAFGVQAITLQADVRSPEACQIWWKIPLPLLGGSMCWSTMRASPRINC